MVRLALSLALVAALSGPAAADDEILFVKGTSLWRLPPGGEPLEVADLGVEADRVGRVQVGGDGRAALVEAEGAAGAEILWIDLERGQVRRPSGAGPAVLSADGRRIACPAGELAIVVHQMQPRPATRTMRRVPAEQIAFVGGSGHLAVVGARGVWRFPIGTTARRRLIAPHAPESGLLVSPSGRRAVATFEDKGGTALESFKLDGKGSRRRLMRHGRAIAWSLDSRWLVVQARGRACVVSAVGGQYKCWDGYRALSIDSDVKAILLSRDGDLYRAPVTGARAENPALVQRGTASASWISRPDPLSSPAR
jgi:hypothetical protein